MQDDPARGEFDLAAPELLDPGPPVDDLLSHAKVATHLTSWVRDYLLPPVCDRTHGTTSPGQSRRVPDRARPVAAIK
jgi:hypothetical protein